MEDNVFRGVLNILEAYDEKPSPQAKSKERQRQPIFWNPQFIVSNGHMLGYRRHLAWGRLISAPAANYKEWLEFRTLHENIKWSGRAYMADGLMLFYEVKKEGQLLQMLQESAEYRWLIF